MERGHDPIRREVSWTPTSIRNLRAQEDGNSLEDNADRISPHDWEREKQGWVKVKSVPASNHANHPGRKTNLSRSASLSEKELKEARTRSHIIATQLTVPTNSTSRGVQLFNRRRQRVNAFTLVSVAGEEGEEGEEGGRGDHHESKNDPDLPSSRALTWDRKHSTNSQTGDLNHQSIKTHVLRPSVKTHSRRREMEEAGEVMREVGDVEARFLPVNEKDEELTEDHGEPAKDEITSSADNGTAVPDRAEEEEAELKGANEGPAKLVKPMPNGCHNTDLHENTVKPVPKQTSTLNRTARPFFSSAGMSSAGSVSPVPNHPPVSSYSTPPLHQEPPPSAHSALQPSTHTVTPFAVTSRPAFSPPPPAPSYPTPPLPSYVSQPPSVPTNPAPPSVTSRPPAPTHCAPTTAPRPTFVPQLLSERRSITPIRTGILDEGRTRRANRKSMFTFQEKPKLPPNPELLSLVQGTDDMKRTRGQAESQQEEELLALGAEASNFLAKEESRVEEALVPEWATTLRSSRTRARMELKPEQALTEASGKGAELFAKRQTRMERYIHENAAGLRSPSPTMSLPPSWVYPSNKPGRVKAIVNSSNIGTQISKNLQTQQATHKKNAPTKAPVPIPAPVQENLENGCSRVEMELSRHQPYQLNSSLFILNPTKDPMSTLPRAAPPPKPLVPGSSFSRQTSLPSSPIPTQYSPSTSYRTAHCFSPPAMSPGVASSGVASPVPGFTAERVASPRSSVQVPKPTFSAKKAGITPQGKEESLVARPSSRSSTPTPWTPSMSRRESSAEGPSNAVWSPSSHHSSVVTSPLPQTVQNIITTSATQRPLQSPVSPSPLSRSTQNPVLSSPSPRPFQSPTPSTPISRLISNRPASTPISPPWETRCQSPISPQDTKTNHRLLAKNIINAAKRKNSPSPGALSGHGLPMSPVSSRSMPFEPKPMSPFQSRPLGAHSPTFISPPPTPTGMVRSPPRLYNTRSLTDSDASLESEDSGVRSPGARSYNTCPRGWTGSLKVKRGAVSEDL